MVSFRTWIGIFGACLCAFMAALDSNVTNASLKVIQGALSASMQEASWMSTSYRIAELIITPLSPWFGQVFSARRYMLVSGILFAVLSVFCAFARDLNSIIILRTLQGLTGGALIPMALAVILTELPVEKRAIGFAIYGSVSSIAPTLGPTLGGWLTENLGWQYIFYLNVVPGILMSLAVWWGLPVKSVRLDLLKAGDWCGILTLAIALGCLEVVLEEGTRLEWFGSQLIVCLSIIAATAFAAWLLIELTVERPLVELRLFAQGNFARANVLGFICYLNIVASVYVLPVCLEQIQCYSPAQIGHVMMWGSLPQFFMVPLIPLLLKNFGSRVLLCAGALIYASSSAMNSQMTSLTGIDQLIGSQIIRGIAQPLVSVSLSAAVMAFIKQSDAANASSLYTMVRYLGASIGVALSGSFILGREHLHSLRLGAMISPGGAVVRERLEMLSRHFLSLGADPVRAGNQALEALSDMVRRQAFVMSFADCFVVGGGLMLAVALCALLFLPSRAPRSGLREETVRGREEETINDGESCQLEQTGRSAS